jgi:hypothetical protein
MSTRYEREVVNRARQIASDASDLDELRRPADHPPHSPGQCVECDARRHLRLASGPDGESLHHIRIRLGVGSGSDFALEQEERQRMEEFEANHPEYREKVADWLEASSRWTEKGGRRPRPPWTEYEDYPNPTRRWTRLDSLTGTRRGYFLARIYALRHRLPGR